MFTKEKVAEIFKRIVGRDPDHNDYPAIVGISKMDGMTEASIASFFAPLAATKVANEFPVLAPPEPIPAPVVPMSVTPVVNTPIVPPVPPAPKPVTLAPTVEPVAKPTPAHAPDPKPFYKPVAKETPKPTPVDLPRKHGADARASQFNFEDDNTPINGIIPPKVEPKIDHKKAHKGKNRK